MSSSIDYFDCPKCGGNAYREQDNRTCDVIFGCKDCDWEGEPIENEEIQEYSKTTVGFVTQQYILKDNEYICIEQHFVAGDQVDRESPDGDVVNIDTDMEVYQSFDMEQPKDTAFEDWYQENKNNDSIQRLYRGVIEDNPDYPLTFMNWCKKFYDECVDI